MAATNIDEVFKKIEKDFVELSKNAAKNAATKAQKDIAKKADQFIKEYYDSYDPKWYRRKYHLYKLVQDYYREDKLKHGIMIEFGVEYSSSKIRGLHKSYSYWHQSGNEWRSRALAGFNFDSRDNGIPRPEWITENFLEGIHPSGKLGDNDGIRDPLSPDEKMQSFFNRELGDLVATYISGYLLDSVKYYF